MSFVNPVWNIFQESVDDRSITSYDYINYGTTEGKNVSQNNSNGATYRIVTKDLDSYLLPSKAMLDIVFKVRGDNVAAAGPPVVIADTIAANRYQFNDNAMCIFSKATHFMNSVDCCSVEQPVLTTTIKNLLEYSKDYSETQGPAQFFYSQKKDNLDGDFDVTLPQVTRISGSNQVRALIPLNRVFGSLEGMSTCTRGIEHRFEFVKEDDSRLRRCLFGDDGAEPAAGAGKALRIDIQELSVWLPRLSPSPEAENMYLSIIRNKDLNEVIAYEAWNGYRASVLGGSQTLNYQITSSSKKPKYVFVALQNVGRLEGATFGANPELRNPSIFDTTLAAGCLINSVTLKINSERFPYERYALDFSAPAAGVPGNYNRAYHDFLRILDKDSELDNGSLVDHEAYRTKYGIFAFDASRSISLFENLQTNYIELEVTTTANMPQQVYVNSVIVWDRELRLQSDSASLKITRD